MSCAGSERVESSKSFDCRNMGDILGKEREKKDSSLARSIDNVLRDEVEEAVSSGPNSESDSEKDLDSDEDLSWLLPINNMELGGKNCKCEGCLKLFESYNTDKKNAKLLLSSWKEFRNYIRNAYINSPLEAIERNQSISFEDNERLHEIVQVMRLCDPYQLFQKIEDEVCSMVLESRIRQLNLLKDEDNPTLAEEFIAGLIEEYVKLLSSALQLSPAIENLLGPQLQRFGLTWEVLNKQLYRSLVYNHFDVQQNLIRFLEQLRKMLPVKNDMYHELVHQYLALDGEMTLIGTMWKDVEPLIQEYRNLKTKENEKLNNLLDAMKDFFANKLCSEEELEDVQNKDGCSTSDNAVQCCPNCMARRSCPCDECTVTHMMSCEDILLAETPLDTNTPLRSRSPSVKNETESKDKREVEENDEKQSCECHACTVPPPDLMDCSVAFNQPSSKNSTHGEGFQLYPHIHGTASEAENVSNIYGSLQTTNDSVYSHLYNLHNQTNSDNSSKVNNSLRHQFVQAIMSNKVSVKPLQSENSPPPTPPPPPPPPRSEENTPLAKNPLQSLSPNNSALKNVDLSSEKLEQLATPRKLVDENSPGTTSKKNNSEKSKKLNSKNEGKKNDSENKEVVQKENCALDKTVPEKHQAKVQGSNKANGCVISGLCGKCCLKHGSNCSKMSGCNKSTDKHLAAIARLNLSSNSTSRAPARHGGAKDDHSHRTAKSHSCNKSKHQENKKASSRNKKNLEVDDSTSPEDSCSESSNSPASFQKDPRHCDCCYCEVFGHGVPSVAPVSRNYQEMRERLRLRLNMKKSAKCKTLQPGQAQQQPSQKVMGAPIKSQSNSIVKPGDAKKEVKEQDLESLIKFIEGKKVECRDAKKAAKRARQKQKKQEEKEKLEEEEEERKRLEAVKKHVSISFVNNNNHATNNGNNNNIGSNKRSQNQAKQNPQLSKSVSQCQKFSQPQTLNLSGLKSLVEKSDPSAVPKMVTIRRVMAPFSAEPTVTITLKGSTPDKDKVLFMLKNGNETLPMEKEEPVSKKNKKKKKKAKQEAEMYEEEPVYERVEEVSSSKKKKGKNKNSEITSAESLSNRSQLSKILPESIDSTKNKCKNSKNNAKISAAAAPKVSGSNKSSQNSTVMKPQSQNKSQPVLNSKNNSQKNVSVLKAQSKDSVTKASKKDSKSVHSSCSDQLNKNSVSNPRGNVKGVGVNNNVHKKELINGKSSSNNNNKNSSNSNNNSNSNRNNNGNPNQRVKSGKNSNSSINAECEKSVKKHKTEDGQSFSRVQAPQTKKVNELNKSNQKSTKNIYGFPQKLENNQNLEIFPVQNKKEKVTTKTKSNKKSLANEVEVNWKGPFGRQEGGKLVINTPSYRLSEVLSSIAPSPPPKEEISLENLRLPPGITITKIEGPIQKPVRPPAQVSHTLKPSPPIVMATPSLKPNPPGNVIVVDTGRLKEVMKENPQLTTPSTSTTTSSKKKKKKNKKQAENEAPTFEIPINQARTSNKIPKNYSSLNKGTMTMLSAMDTRKMTPSLENQQATIIKTSDNMVTIRSPALQQAMNMHAYQASQNFKPGINGYSNINLFNEEVNKINEKISKMKLGAESNDRLTKQMRNLSIKEGSRGNDMVAQAMSAPPPQNNPANPKKKKKKKKQKSGDEREVEPVESVFQPKDIDLENGDIDDDERELEAFKRFCLQSVPPERKDKVKVNLNIKDIVLKKKSSLIGCS